MFMLGLMVMGMVASTAMPSGMPGATVLGTSIYADTVEAPQGKCGDNVTYKYDNETKTLTISGTGPMWDDYGFAKVLYDTQKIVIESGVTTIGSYSFYDLTEVQNVVIADSVTTIKENAFWLVYGTIELPKSIAKVEANAFSGASKFVIKGDVKGFETSALGAGADEMILYGEAQDLGKALYYGKADTITIAQENSKCKVSNGCLLSIDGKQLYYALSTRDTVKIPESVENISVAAFSNKDFEELELGQNVKKIGAFAFSNTTVKTLIVNSNLKSIGIKAFDDTEIRNIEFEGKVKLGVASFDNKVKVKYNKFKASQTTIDTAKVGKKKYNIKFAKVFGAKGYQIKVKKGKKTYKYTTTKNTFKKKAPEALTKEYRKNKEYSLENNEYLEKVSGAAYVTVRPYKTVKNKKVYGRWSAKTVLSYK